MLQNFVAHLFEIQYPPNGSKYTFSLPSLLQFPVSDVEWSLVHSSEPLVSIQGEQLTLSTPTGPTQASPILATVAARKNEGAAIAVIKFIPVAPKPPTPPCELKAIPDFIHLGESLTLQLSTEGDIFNPTINGVDISVRDGSMIFETEITPTTAGIHQATASVSGPGGTTHCMTKYGVK